MKENKATDKDYSFPFRTKIKSMRENLKLNVEARKMGRTAAHLSYSEHSFVV